MTDRKIVLDIECQSGNAQSEQSEARVETTATGVRWTITGKLAKALAAAEAATAERCAKIADEMAESILGQEAWDPDDENYDMDAYEEAEYAASVAGSVAHAIRKGITR